jgi:hypothetical protein
MPLFMIAICYDPTIASDGSPSRQAEHARLTEEMRGKGHYVSGAGLAPLDMYAKRVYQRRERPVVVDGPFAETKEAIGGYFIVDCTGEEALEYAGRIPVNNRSWLEVRRAFAYTQR